MSSSVGLSATKLLPIAGSWAAPFTLYFLTLSSRVAAERLKTKVFIGDTCNCCNKKDAANQPHKSRPDPLQLAIRCHSNFLQTVPLAFVLLTIAELNGGNREALTYLMATLFALRVAHADGGMRLRGNFGGGAIGRPLGYIGSMGVLAGLAGYSTYLVRAYWGF
ncbi:hypothetical protein NA56DRAFT_178255 [Hyaloscypha hepaticicola]|uniref:Membrane-associated proteins in eicosanoid and glutathione metabolism n=1 Tax=Hyaloscypha hepaticicola TaxID=2082293 RepID=A0A2J6Q221_9HELO|nr:hypothetical protein NA56DRAFT_178255 [Hyaloscypha hepaticicola]